MSYMADRHQRGMVAAIDRLEEVSEELECHRGEYKIVVREIKKVERKKMKIVKRINLTKGINHLPINGNADSPTSGTQDASRQQAVFYTS